MRIVVGMSGGVDSSVAAYLLKKQGHEVIGVFMNNWEEDGVCTSEQDFRDVRAVCDVIGIPYYSVSFAKEYMDRVFTHFLEEYKRGRTPNPDVMCNREIKFASLMELALSLGAEKLATGHFAGVEKREDGKYHLLKAKDENKDQTYFLCTVTQEQLPKAMFPLRDLTKPEIREIAKNAGIPVYQKKDSTGVCFIGERNFKQFLSNYLPAQPGDICTPDGKKVGRHDGLMYYTLGQRRGLGIGGCGDGRSWFVVDKDLPGNRLIVAQGEDHPLLYSVRAECSDVAWVAEAPAEGEPFRCTCKYRYRQQDQDVTATVENGVLTLVSDRPQRAVTPGQSAVLYQGQRCLGGGIVDRIFR
jgi:tRNA-specific 2-thiouridylase